MSYRNKNLLMKIVEIQNLTLEQKKRGVTQKWIYENLIAQHYYISRTTYYNYLACNAKKQLKDLENCAN